MCVSVVPDSSRCAKCGLYPIKDADWLQHLYDCQGIDLRSGPKMYVDGVELKIQHGSIGAE